ncbi:MAG: hypothetical protein LLF76_13930 [Planctomycetaceae bacterium]|nr:hypothetical protein [Planctomycetaceae bacterium]
MRRQNLIILLTIVVGLSLVGCRQGQPASEIPIAQTVLTAECIASYYKVDSSAYITEQTHQFTPESGQLSITANEPSGRFHYILQQEQFTAAETGKTLSDLPQSFFNQALATAVFYGVSAGGSLLDTSAMSSEEPAKIEGQWYVPIKPEWPNNSLSVTLLRNQDSQQIELVRVSEPGSGVQYMARSYNFRYNSDLGTRIPRTIDIYDVANGLASKRLIVKFDYKDVRVSKEAELSETNGLQQQ